MWEIFCRCCFSFCLTLTVNDLLLNPHITHPSSLFCIDIAQLVIVHCLCNPVSNIYSLQFSSRCFMYPLKHWEESKRYWCPVPEVSEALLVFSPGAVKADRPIKSLLYDCPSTSEGLHVTEDLKCPILWIRGHAIHTILPRLQHIVVWTVPWG